MACDGQRGGRGQTGTCHLSRLWCLPRGASAWPGDLDGVVHVRADLLPGRPADLGTLGCYARSGWRVLPSASAALQEADAAPSLADRVAALCNRAYGPLRA